MTATINGHTGKAGAQPAGAEASAPAPTGTVHQRKLRVMARCSEIAPDKTHPAHHFQYVSIQTLSNHLRRFCAEEGLDVVTSIEEGDVVVSLINADVPDERIVSRWPVVAGDKGFAYSIKFPLMRLFLVGDGEEGDEKEMADRSSDAATRQAQQRASLPPARTNGRAAAPPAESTAPRAEKGEPCPTCFELGIKSRKGETAFFWTQGGVTHCNGFKDGEFVNHRPQEPVAVGDVDQDSIPF